MILTLFSLVPDTGNTVHPSSAVAVVESINVSVVKIKCSRLKHSYRSDVMYNTKTLWLLAMLGSQASVYNSLIIRSLRKSS